MITLRLQYSAISMFQRYPNAMYRGLTTTTVQNQKQSRFRNRNKLLRSKTKEGMFLSREQVERIWNIFYDTTDESTKHEGKVQEFDIQRFVAKYPHVSPELNQIAQDKQNIDDIKSPPLHSPLAEEAEIKLQRMMNKVQQHSSQTNQTDDMEISFQILSLLSQELDAVVDLWIRISNSNSCQTLQQAIDATDRASYLLFKFQNMNRLSVIQFPPFSIKTVQCVIQQYHHLYTVNKSTLSINQIKHMQHKCLDLLKCMTKQVLRIRMSNGNSSSTNDVDGDHFLSTMIDGALPLNESYRIVIFILTDVHNHARFSQDEKNESVKLASKLIKEMELYTHEMIMNDFDVDSKDMIQSNEFFRSIYPSHDCFHMVIEAYARLGVQYKDVDPVRRANDIIDRMIRRYNAYCRESKVDTASMGYIIEYVALPNMAIYECLLKSYSDLRDSLTSDDLSRIIQIWERIKSQDDLSHEAVKYVQICLKQQDETVEVLSDVEELLQKKWNPS